MPAGEILQPSVIIQFRSTPLYKDKSFLLENYVEKGLNIDEAALKFGETRRKREIVVNQRELAAFEKMKALRAQGFSYWKIADVLNNMGVRTKTGRGKWQARSVQKTLTGQ